MWICFSIFTIFPDILIFFKFQKKKTIFFAKKLNFITCNHITDNLISDFQLFVHCSCCLVCSHFFTPWLDTDNFHITDSLSSLISSSYQRLFWHIFYLFWSVVEKADSYNTFSHFLWFSPNIWYQPKYYYFRFFTWINEFFFCWAEKLEYEK